MIPDDRDSPERVRARSEQEDPWVMYLVVRHDLAPSPRALYQAAAQATMDCVARHGPSDAWREPFRAWAERSFRKVTLRARGAAWERLSGYDRGEASVDGEALVRALPPRLRSACGAHLRNLQVYNPDPASLGPDAPAAAHPDAMPFVINPAARMSVGKTVAQVSHAVLMCAWAPLAGSHRDAFARWQAAGWPCAFLPGERWEELRASGRCVVVRDAGLTEVTPGTETVLALPPG